MLFFGIQIVVLGLWAVLFHVKEIGASVPAIVAGGASVGVAFSLLFVATEGSLGNLAMAFSGACFALLYLPWFQAFGKLDTRQAFCCIFGCQAIAGLLGACAAFFSPNIRALAFAVCAVASTASSLDAEHGQPPAREPTSFYEKGSRREPAQYAALLFLFGLSAGYFNQGDASQYFVEPSTYFAVWSVGATLLALVCLALIDRQRIEPSLNLVWRLFVVTMLACFLGAQAFPDSPLGQATINCVVCMGRTTVVNVFTLAMIDIARYARWKTSAVLSAGYSISILSFLIPEAVGIAIGGPLSSLPSFWIVAFVIISGSLLLVRERDFSSARVFAELCSPSRPLSALDAMESQCSRVAKQYGLSNREADVLRYLSAGRTRAYIAETLFISESTVASHSKRIYQKLGVHSKRELMDLVESDQS